MRRRRPEPAPRHRGARQGGRSEPAARPRHRRARPAFPSGSHRRAHCASWRRASDGPACFSRSSASAAAAGFSIVDAARDQALERFERALRARTCRDRAAACRRCARARVLRCPALQDRASRPGCRAGRGSGRQGSEDRGRVDGLPPAPRSRCARRANRSDGSGRSGEGWSRDFADGGRVGTCWNDLSWHSNLTNRTGHVVAC